MSFRIVFLSFLQKNRSDIPCYWESQPSGCLKPHCSFLHTKPRPNEPPPKVNATVPLPILNQVQPVQPVHPLPATPIPRANVPVPRATVPIPRTAAPLPGVPSMANQEAMKIPTLSSSPRQRPPMQQNVSITRLPAPVPYPTVSSRPMLVPQPPQMIRAPQFTGPPRPRGMVQPVSAGRGFPPVMPGVPVRYRRGVLNVVYVFC